MPSVRDVTAGLNGEISLEVVHNGKPRLLIDGHTGKPAVFREGEELMRVRLRLQAAKEDMRDITGEAYEL